MGPNARGQLAPRHCVRHRERKASHPTCKTPLPQKKIVITDMGFITQANRTGTYYPVVFGTNSNVRKFFAPLNGEIKPDSEDVRDLLIRDGWLETEEEDKASWLLSR